MNETSEEKRRRHFAALESDDPLLSPAELRENVRLWRMRYENLANREDALAKRFGRFTADLRELCDAWLRTAQDTGSGYGAGLEEARDNVLELLAKVTVEPEPECDHERVFSGERFCTNNAQWHWVCAKCRATGVQQFGEGDDARPPTIDRARFSVLTTRRRT